MVFAAPAQVSSCAGFRTPAALISPRAPLAGVRKAPRHEIASGGSGKAVPQESGAAKRLWGFRHAGGADEVAAARVERYFFGMGRMSRSIQMNAALAAEGDFVCGRLQCERINAGPGTAGGEPAETSLVVIVDQQ
jgi:hypothetical protein